MITPPQSLDVLDGAPSFTAYVDRGTLLLRPAKALATGTTGHLISHRDFNHIRLGWVTMGLYDVMQYPYPVAIFFDNQTGDRLR